MRARRRADGRVGDAVGQPGLARRPDPAAARVRAATRASRRRTTPPAAAAGHFVQASRTGEPFVDAVVDGDRLAGRLHQPGRRGVVARAGQARCWRSASRGSRPTTARAITCRIDVRLADGRTGAQAAWALGGLYRQSMQRALDEVHPGQRCAVRAQRLDRAARRRAHMGRRSGVGLLVAARAGGRDASRRLQRLLELVARHRRLPRHRLVERCPPELLVRWLQFGCFTPLMHAHGRMPQEPWHYGGTRAGALSRLRAAARAAVGRAAAGPGCGPASRWNEDRLAPRSLDGRRRARAP